MFREIHFSCRTSNFLVASLFQTINHTVGCSIDLTLYLSVYLAYQGALTLVHSAYILHLAWIVVFIPDRSTYPAIMSMKFINIDINP